MSRYTEKYQTETGKDLPEGAEELDALFDKIAENDSLPPRGQQAVDLGFTAHTLNDSKENPPIYRYYQWIMKHMFADKPINELTSKLVGMSFVSANIFETNLPQPITLNPWQIERMTDVSLMTDKAIIVENNGVFIWLYSRHPDWPLINQSGNDFNEAYNTLLSRLADSNLQMTYLGDLDSDGIRIADHLSTILNQNLFEIQTSKRVFDWLIRFGKTDINRTKMLNVKNETMQEEMESIHTLHKFVEQEQLISEYETLIEQWLKKNTLD